MKRGGYYQSLEELVEGLKALPKHRLRGLTGNWVEDLKVLFLKNVAKNKKGCWIWQGPRGSLGNYGKWTMGHRHVLAHRGSFFIHGGILSGDKTCVCHSCDVPLCVNPGHLWAGTQAQNNKDCSEKGRHRSNPRTGEQVPTAKLTEKAVLEIRASRRMALAVGERWNSSDLSKKYGVTKKTLWAVAVGKLWRHTNGKIHIPRPRPHF